jgi:multiple sugar transport system ATP-binding protein
MADIKLNGLSKGWGAVTAVDRIDLEIRDKEFMVFLGPSGCGKTTTMRMIAGLEMPTGGDIEIDGERVTDVDPRDRDVAMVFQSYALYPNMTIFENIRFPLRVRGVPVSEHDERVRRAAQMVELGDYLHRKPAALSGGQRQRAALARAIVRQPRVFLMDEPLSNLDAKLRTSMRAQLKHLQRELKITTIYVTHDQIEAMTLADRIVIMDKGKIQQLGTPDEIYADPANTFVAGFIGSPPMNLVKGAIKDGHFHSSHGDVTAPALGLKDNDAMVLGVRPEDTTIASGGLHLQGNVYAVEPTGDMTLVGLRLKDGTFFNIKADRDFRQALDTPLTAVFDPKRLYFFDAAKGERLKN